MQIKTSTETFPDGWTFDQRDQVGMPGRKSWPYKKERLLSAALTRLLMTPPPYPDISVTTVEAAIILGLSDRTLRNWRWKGGDDRPVWVKLGNRRNSPVRYPLGPLIAWRDSHKRRSTTGS